MSDKKPHVCFGSLNPSDHNFEFSTGKCAWCGAYRAIILDAAAERALEEALAKLK